MKRHPSGQNFVVALSTYYGYNMKDAVVLNKAAVDRGLGRSVFYKTYSDEERRYPGSQQDHFKVPPPTTEGYLGEHAYSKLSEDGIIETRDGRSRRATCSSERSRRQDSSRSRQASEWERRRSSDNSVTLKAGEEGIVDNVMLCETTSATKIVKVRIRSIKVPEIGDKFASRHGQKGVVALIVDQNDMPFTKDGIVPDLLLNPLSLARQNDVRPHARDARRKGRRRSMASSMDGTPFSTDGKEPGRRIRSDTREVTASTSSATRSSTTEERERSSRRRYSPELYTTTG